MNGPRRAESSTGSSPDTRPHRSGFSRKRASAAPACSSLREQSATLSRTPTAPSSSAAEAGSFQSLCGPFAFRARLHGELGDHAEAGRLLEELLSAWTETRSGYIDGWVVDAWFAARSTGTEARLQRAIETVGIVVPWLDAATALLRHDFIAAAATLEQMGASATAADVQLWAGEWLDEHGRPSDANVQLERSLTFWRSVGARGYLRRCESLLAAAS